MVARTFKIACVACNKSCLPCSPWQDHKSHFLLREEERRESRKEDVREGGVSWNISKYWGGIKGAVRRAWGRLQIGTDPSLFLCCPKTQQEVRQMLLVYVATILSDAFTSPWPRIMCR